MKEDKLQAKVVRWFGEKYPEQKFKLIAINNNSFSASQAMYNRSMGLSKSAPDLIFLHNGQVLGLELKAPKTRHNKEHILHQLEFGQQMILNNFYYIMEFDFEKIQQIIEYFFSQKKLYCEKILNINIEKIKTIKTKTIEINETNIKSII